MGDAPGTFLVVDDDCAVGKTLVVLLAQAGHDAVHVTTGRQAIEALERQPFDVVLTYLQMPIMDGLMLLREVSLKWPGLPVVLLTAHGSVAVAVEAIKAGATDFIVKPFDKAELLFVMSKALLSSVGRNEAAAPHSSLGRNAAELLGGSPSMRQVLSLLRKAASGSATVLVRGETGTGKELVVRALHEASARSSAPLITVHCGALPDALLESELFGYEKGAFTGASTRKLGRFELAHKGTLFFDEIGDISPAVQVKLLRVLQERTFERVGGTQPIRVDVRFVAATHRNLELMVAHGAFREDLFYRLNVLPIWVPPLRDRPGDVRRLATYFCNEFGRTNGRARIAFEESAFGVLEAHPWPGNVRQLQSLVERLVVFANGEAIASSDVQRELGAAPRYALSSPIELAERSVELDLDPGQNIALDLEAGRRTAEREVISRALERTSNNRTQAARLLGVSRRTLYNKLRDHDLD